MNSLRDLCIEKLSTQRQDIDTSNIMWNKRAEEFSKNVLSEKDDYIDYFLSHADIKNKTVIDIGCGSGKYLKLLLDQGAIVEGLEPSINMIKKSKEYLNSSGYDSDKIIIHNVALQDFEIKKQYDYVFISNSPVISYFENYDKILSLAKEGIFIGSWLESRDSLLDYVSKKLNIKIKGHGGNSSIYFFNLLLEDTRKVCFETLDSEQIIKIKENLFIERYANWIYGVNYTDNDISKILDIISKLKDENGLYQINKSSKRSMIFAYK
ncbi:class I SAM-dependent methyltransferase [Helcococcus ovis]|uniref:Class I SAM-dependent methyltransferase n=1 Tax=Helcococcus ovis TaxID=72026 RepID=A0A4R9C2V6_9FIRM|nr:class I SAM-dependent methyltransferase [Helcococcus ovis]TFF66003.1 class I SAM-dependent methyltransferase [Helcococcus ovis]TFF67005.1 class I SAM-dependent methyltransferase [Helcococcus ovis]TFF68612.1 class I SAM-dependent methyltransferase [Helcococcus ovis]WNZ01339.1 class I SAM-dependent methyltransferase [Helcococcus ovis]